jgi:hypothetical protein
MEEHMSESKPESSKEPPDSKKGAKVRAEKLSAEKRKQIARAAAIARWNRYEKLSNTG